ncbi:unnamed protein product [Mytilus coruscus]|uniref:Uncharacterized protein n=1 Tax=Mytilus coruscus TaxID=42192 RepID=A0A6J8CGY8_MYTCO|nr:unnamed protein product [Mytilus coruscus]
MFSNEKKTAKPGKTPDNYKKQIHNKLDSAFEGLDIFSDQQEEGVIFKKGYPVADCDNDTPIPYVDDQPFSQSSPIHSQTNPFVSSWTGQPTLPSSITHLRPSIIHSPLIPSTLSKKKKKGICCRNSRLQTPQHFAALYPKLPTTAPATTSFTTTAASVSTATTTSVTTTTATTGAGATATTIPSTSTNSSGRTVQPSMNIINMSSIWKIEKFKGDNTQSPET